ncbi:hypothetical protein [Methylobacterium gnaphalii]|uniref:Uncharacterized protein n=1 Tax=Methylobacterium gnaphalii TaxID=1010610 RepID=A0A512JG24_9HYPH|nr:hypothetical protein [Methylobacterium gnaphalii]GEP08904.1 hypothetical protein MGN01_07490 [Methylobacterium gnaphalii]GJD70670.1 hypothetical protein MMMDOFMJ_3622 [Methylobacterium gnaphalii]GLS50450.1 hypothetical protein GCM10007885_33020 [Methylobacterium gnaphalii]
MLTDTELHGLARTVVDLPPEQERAVADAVAGIRAERAQRREERLAELRAMSDEDVMMLMFARHHDNWPNPDALTLLREAGFVRGAVLEKACREGY